MDASVGRAGAGADGAASDPDILSRSCLAAGWSGSPSPASWPSRCWRRRRRAARSRSAWSPRCRGRSTSRTPAIGACHRRGRAGECRIFDRAASTLLATPVAWISRPRSRRAASAACSVAFHPDYAANGFFYVDYTNLAGDTVIERYHVSAGHPQRGRSGQRDDVAGGGQPFANHNGGQLQIGRNDGYLYIGMGDGGSGGSPIASRSATTACWARCCGWTSGRT